MKDNLEMPKMNRDGKILTHLLLPQQGLVVLCENSIIMIKKLSTSYPDLVL